MQFLHGMHRHPLRLQQRRQYGLQEAGRATGELHVHVRDPQQPMPYCRVHSLGSLISKPEETQWYLACRPR